MFVIDNKETNVMKCCPFWPFQGLGLLQWSTCMNLCHIGIFQLLLNKNSFKLPRSGSWVMSMNFINLLPKLRQNQEKS